jgi:hypothetical protein
MAYHIYTGADDLIIDATSSVDVSIHDGLTKGLKLGGVLVTATAAELNRVADAGSRIVNTTAASVTLSAAVHDSKILTVNKADGCAITLPAATGGGSSFRVFIGTTITSNTSTIKVANGSDTMVGFGTIFQDGGDTAIHFEIGGTDDTLTFNGSTSGGIKGDMIELVDIATNLWYVREILSGTGAEADNTSATV